MKINWFLLKKIKEITFILIGFILLTSLSHAAVIIDDGTSALCAEPKGIDHYFANDGKSDAPSEIIGLTDGQPPFQFRSFLPVQPSDISAYINSSNKSSMLDGILYRILPYPDDIAGDIDNAGRTYAEVYGLIPGEENEFNESTIPFAMNFVEYGTDGASTPGKYSFPGGSNQNLPEWLTSAQRIDYQNYINEEVLPAQQNTNGLSADNTTTYIPMFIACLSVYNSETQTTQTTAFPLYSQTGDDGINLENHTVKEAFYGYTANMTQDFSAEWGMDIEGIGRTDAARRFASLALGITQPSVGTDQQDSVLLQKLNYQPIDGVDCTNPEAWLPGRYKPVGTYQIPDVDQCADGNCSIFGSVTGFLGSLLGSASGALAGLIGDQYTLYLFTDTYLDSMAKYYNRYNDVAFWDVIHVEGQNDIPGDPSFIVAGQDVVSEDEKYLLEEWYDGAGPNSLSSGLDVCVTIDLFGPNYTDCRKLAVRSPNIRQVARYCQMQLQSQLEGIYTKDENDGYKENGCEEILASLYTLDQKYNNLGPGTGPGSNGDGSNNANTGDFEVEIAVAPADSGANDVQQIGNEELPTVLRWRLDVTAKYPTKGLDIKNELSVFNNTFNAAGDVTGEQVVEKITEAPFLEVSVNGENVSTDILGGFNVSSQGYELNAAGDGIDLLGDLIGLNSIRFEQIELARGDKFTLVFETAAYNAKPYIDSKVQYKVTVDGLEIDKGINISPGTVFMGLYGRPGGWGSLRKASTASGMVNLVADYIQQHQGKISGATDVVGYVNVNLMHGESGCPTNFLSKSLAQELVTLAAQNNMIVMFDLQPVSCSEAQLKNAMKEYYLGDNVTFDIDLEWARPNISVTTINNLADYYYSDLGGTVPFFGAYYFSVTERYLSGSFSSTDARITPIMDGFGSCGGKIAVTKQMIERFGKTASDIFGGMEFVTAWGSTYDKCGISEYFTQLRDMGGDLFMGQ